MEDFAVAWTRSAVADLDAITAHIARQSEQAAETVRSAVLEHVQILSRFPFIGPVYPRDRRGTTREIVYRKYRIFYRVAEAERRVEILTVWHGARRDPEFLP